MADPLIFGTINIEAEEKKKQEELVLYIWNALGFGLGSRHEITFAHAKQLWPLASDLIDEIEKREMEHVRIGRTGIAP